MSETDGDKKEEPGDLLSEKPGRTEDHSVDDWLEAEYLAHPAAAFHRPADAVNEVDLGMRGLGSLTTAEAPTPDVIVWQSEEVSEHGTKRGLLLLSCLIVAGVVIVAGTRCFLSRKRRSSTFM